MAHAISTVETRRSTRASTGRPSSTPAWLRALAVLVVLGGARAADYWQQDGKNDGDPAPTCADEASTAAVRCCTPTASSCDSICTNAQHWSYRTPLTGIDGLAASHAEAIAECAAHGWRLCTRAELAGVCIGTGCGMDNLLLWTLDGCSPPAPPLSPSPPPSPPSPPSPPPSPPLPLSSIGAKLYKLIPGDTACADPGGATGAVRCCAENGASCKSPDCSLAAVSYAAASAKCDALSMRLCTEAEQLALCGGTGCSFDHEYVWTSDECTLPLPPALPPPCENTKSASWCAEKDCTKDKIANEKCRAHCGTCTP